MGLRTILYGEVWSYKQFSISHIPKQLSIRNSLNGPTDAGPLFAKCPKTAVGENHGFIVRKD